ncbi:hypothetical protein [Ornithinimicrobium kibberense]|uniref:hypothetical protein n=1 Tax=Ornithinimicrobium kibberense TaxID=282060 RepID=UPI00360A4790
MVGWWKRIRTITTHQIRVPLRDSIQAWSVGVAGRPKCWAMATMAMNLRVWPAIICEPLSETASSSGVASSTPSRPRGAPIASARSRAASSSPSASRACSKARRTWVCVSCAETTWVSHLRETRSSMISTAIPARGKCVES